MRGSLVRLDFAANLLSSDRRFGVVIIGRCECARASVTKRSRKDVYRGRETKQQRRSNDQRAAQRSDENEYYGPGGDCRVYEHRRPTEQAVETYSSNGPCMYSSERTTC